MKKLLVLTLAALFVSGCSITTYVKLPEDTVLKIKRGQELPHEEGELTRTPLSWSSAGGIPYKLEKDGEIVQEGRMSSKFRVASIFWPPAGAIYWPMGFRHKCYDFTTGEATPCSGEVLSELKKKESQKTEEK